MAETERDSLIQYQATYVGVVADTDHGEGCIVFRWPHEHLGYELLKISLDGHCSRRMPIHSGSGPPEFVELRRDGVRVRFAPELARKLQMDEEVEILFTLADPEFEELRRVVEFFDGTGDSQSA